MLQGIGFRPFVYRLANRHFQTGWVANDNSHVIIEAEGDALQQQHFLTALQHQLPICGYIEKISLKEIPRQYDKQFQLKTSLNQDNENSAFVCADIATCQDCITELFDFDNPRYLHPFISCCHCGPRFSIITKLPYDRHNTTLGDFSLCDACLSEYQNPLNRRFHAQTISCPNCGPQLSCYNAKGQLLATKHEALEIALSQLRLGKIIAVKGIGGFQLLVDAGHSAAVSNLRQRKQRQEKPFALMLPSLQYAGQLCELNQEEEKLLLSAAAPIVLAQAKMDLKIAAEVAPNQALLGIMLPYSPLHHLILKSFDAPLVVSSGNQHAEPICIDTQQAFERLSSIADYFLSHDRAILRPLDDSIVRVIGNKPTVLRRARGYVPTPISLNDSIPPTLAVGGHLKNTIAIANKQHVILSQHLGDLEQSETIQQFHKTIDDVTTFYAIKPQVVICDKHPDYVSSQYADNLKLPITHVQHHYAHILSCMAEHRLQAPLLGVSWDGSGLGENNQLWGGEFLLIQKKTYQRIAHLRPFPIPGGLQAFKEPRRAALGLLYAAFGDALFSDDYSDLLSVFSLKELKLLRHMLQKKLNCQPSSSIV